MQADSAQRQEEGVSGRSPLSTPGCQRAFCTVVLSSIHEFISYWDRDNRISAASILESVGGWRGESLNPLASPHNGWVCARLDDLCDCVGLYSCQTEQMLFSSEKAAHSAALVLPPSSLLSAGHQQVWFQRFIIRLQVSHPHLEPGEHLKCTAGSTAGGAVSVEEPRNLWPSVWFFFRR